MTIMLFGACAANVESRGSGAVGPPLAPGPSYASGSVVPNELAVLDLTDQEALASSVAALGGQVVGYESRLSVTQLRFEGLTTQQLLEVRDTLRSLGFNAVAVASLPVVPTTGDPQ